MGKKSNQKLSRFTLAIIIILGTMFFFKGILLQQYIVTWVKYEGVFDRGKSRNEWTDYYRRNIFAMTDKPWSIDEEKTNDALEKFNTHSSITSKKFYSESQKKQDKGETLFIRKSFNGIQATYLKMETHLSDTSPKVTKKYIQRIVNVVRSADPNRGLIIDLRDHRGGKYYTALTGLSGLIDNDEPLLFTLNGPSEKKVPFKVEYKKSGTKKSYVVNGINSEYEHYVNKRRDLKVAVLIGPDTCSAAEFITLALRSNDNQVRTFGSETGGYTSSNIGIGIPRLNLTNSWIESKDGTILKNDPISPDVQGIDSEKIESWLYSSK